MKGNARVMSVTRDVWKKREEYMVIQWWRSAGAQASITCREIVGEIIESIIA